MKTILSADIGATNSRFAHFRSGSGATLELVSTTWLPTGRAASFAELLGQLGESDFTLPLHEADIAVLGVAGPVEQGSFCAPPYIDWEIDLSGKGVGALFQRAAMLNDFVAQAYGCLSPVGKTAKVVLPGEAVPGAAIGVLGAGTALGKALLAPIGAGKYLALPSEGGHAYFPFISPKEFSFQRFYREKSGQEHITANLVVSGPGLRYLHWFLTGEELEPREVAALFTPHSETLAWAAGFYGRLCRDYVLEVLAQGGLYLAGGIAAKNPAILSHPNFRDEFLNSPTMGHLLARIPIFLMDNEDSGLWGAAFYAQHLLGKEES
jgi:glucokinase